MAQTVARGRERPAPEDTRRRQAPADDDDEDDNTDDDYQPGTEDDQTDDDGDDTEMSPGDMKKALAQVLRQNKTLTKQVRQLQKAVGGDNFDSETESGYVEQVYTSDALATMIGGEFGRAFAPVIARLDALEEGQEAVTKAIEEHGVLVEAISDTQEEIKKALGNSEGLATLVKGIAAKQTADAQQTPSVGDTTPTGTVQPDQILQKGMEGDELTAEERAEASSLIQKAQGILSEHYVAPNGFEEAVDAMNAGGFSRGTLVALRKGVEVADQEIQRLVKA